MQFKLFTIKHFYLANGNQIVKTMIQFIKRDVNVVSVNQRWLNKDKNKWVKTSTVFFEVDKDNTIVKKQEHTFYNVEYLKVKPIKVDKHKGA